MGMSFGDFCACTIDELESIVKAWHDMDEARNRDAWERARLMAAIIIQPHLKKKITPRQLLPLPWDSKPSGKPCNDAAPLSPEQRRERFERLVNKQS
ncbi:MAG: hypothetical protein K2L21_05975 [Muribaculaceae bacterium]|nr:hypothetical protein [Muribaculaceae bacterium]